MVYGLPRRYRGDFFFGKWETFFEKCQLVQLQLDHSYLLAPKQDTNNCLPTS